MNHGAPTSHVVYFIQNPDTWDAFMIRHCVCSAYTGGGTSDFPFLGDKRKPPVASKRKFFINSALLYLLLIRFLYVDMVSGYPAMTQNLMGFRGYDCSERNCPVGNLVVSS